MPRLMLARPVLTELPSDVLWDSVEVFTHKRMLWSLGTGVALAAAVATALYEIDPDSLPLGTPSLWKSCMVIAFAVFGHELCHLIGFPAFGSGADTIAGLWPGKGAAYVQHLRPISRNRMLVVLILPFAILTLAPLVAEAIGSTPEPALGWLAVANAVGSGSDILIFVLMLALTPSRSKVLEHGDKLYWTVADTSNVDAGASRKVPL